MVFQCSRKTQACALRPLVFLGLGGKVLLTRTTKLVVNSLAGDLAGARAGSGHVDL